MIYYVRVVFRYDVQNPMNLRTLKFVARDPFLSREQQLATTASGMSVGPEGYDQSQSFNLQSR